jgi:hypothetical protein
MNQSQRVAQYISDNENDDDMELGSFNNSGIVKQKIKQNRRKWIPMCTYCNKDSAIDKIKTDGIWSQTHTNITSDGKRVYYRCNQVKRYENCRFNLFDTYKSVYFNIWCVCLSDNPEEWRTATCTCPSFLKNYICKHVIGMSIRLKYCKPPPEAKNVEVGTKRKRGRPSKARKALLLQ